MIRMPLVVLIGIFSFRDKGLIVTVKSVQSWKEIGWNGIRISVPWPWEVERIGERYVLLAYNDFPVLELKWNHIRGKFSTEKHLKRFKSDYQRQQVGQEIFSWVVPQSWYDLLKTHEITGFKWEGNLFAGKGLILFCRHCRCATLLQFYERRYNIDEKLNWVYQGEILSSFQDHSFNGFILWSVFDIHMMLPEQFRLVRHSFSPGAFELTFETGNCHVSFYRWSPASVLLVETDLQAFAEKIFHFKFIRPLSNSLDNDETLEMESIPRFSGLKKWHQKFSKKPVFKWAKIWHLAPANRILAVKAESDKPLDVDMLNSICSGYGIL